mmetsp:Transcript_1245/g.2153  ORF Transcript_1245/g.2153 Transcript_1245/m.2153 type:complete len:394 (-) Transcript_1245:31-1212(-)
MTRASRIERRLNSDSRDAVCVLGEIGHLDNAANDILTAAALDEIRQLKHPPLAVQRTLEVMHLVLHARRHRHGIPRGGVKWESVLRTMMAEDLAERLQHFDIVELRQSPLLVNDLHEHYFNPREQFEALSPDRVRRASSTACTLFSWSARMVEAASVESPTMYVGCPPSDSNILAAENESSPRNVSESHLPNTSQDVGVEVDASDDAIGDDFEDTGVPPITLGIWGTCPGGHGLDFCCRAMSFTCQICDNSFDKDSDSAFCRECRFFVCKICRTGGWLSVSLSGCDDMRESKVVGFRWLKHGEDAPSPLSVKAAVLQGGQMACWGQCGQAMLGQINVDFRPSFEKCTGGVVASITGMASRFSSNRASGVFSLTDERARNAAVLALFAGFPGVR